MMVFIYTNLYLSESLDTLWVALFFAYLKMYILVI